MSSKLWDSISAEAVIATALVTPFVLVCGLFMYQDAHPTPEKLHELASREVWSATQLPNGRGFDRLQDGDGEHSFEVVPLGTSENGKHCTSFVNYDGKRYITVRNGEQVYNVNPWEVSGDFRWESGDKEVGEISWSRRTDMVVTPITSVDGNGNVSVSNMTSYDTYYDNEVIRGVPEVTCGWSDYPKAEQEVMHRIDTRYQELLAEKGLS